MSTSANKFKIGDIVAHQSRPDQKMVVAWSEGEEVGVEWVSADHVKHNIRSDYRAFRLLAAYSAD